jgi:hypothetical protein
MLNHDSMVKPISLSIIRTKDRIGGTIITESFRLENNTFQAHSSYKKDDKIIGYAENNSEDLAVKLSRKQLRENWKENNN